MAFGIYNIELNQFIMLSDFGKSDNTDEADRQKERDLWGRDERNR